MEQLEAVQNQVYSFRLDKSFMVCSYGNFQWMQREWGTLISKAWLINSSLAVHDISLQTPQRGIICNVLKQQICCFQLELSQPEVRIYIYIKIRLI